MPPLWPGGPWRFEAAVTITECNEQSVTHLSQFAHVDLRIFARSCRCSLGGGGTQIIYSVTGGLQSARYTGRSARAMWCLWVMNTTAHVSGVLRRLPLLCWPGQFSGPGSSSTLGVFAVA